MFSHSVIVSALGYAVFVAAQTPVPLIKLVECDGRSWPDYDACDDLIQEWTGSPDEVGQCVVLSWNGDRNCRMTTCRWDDRPGIGQADASRAMREVSDTCAGDDAGGSALYYDFLGGEDLFEIGFENDPLWTGSVARLGRRKDSNELLDDLASSSEITSAGVHKWTISVEDLDAVHAAEEEKATDNVAKTVNAPSNVLDKRQGTFYLRSRSVAIRNPDVREAAGPILGSGAEYTWSVSESNSVGVSMSTSLEAGFWEVFKVSVSIETSMEWTVSYEESYTFTSGDCDRGQNYYYPLFDRYIGYFTSDYEDVTIWIPRAENEDLENPVTEGMFLTECLGS